MNVKGHYYNGRHYFRGRHYCRRFYFHIVHLFRNLFTGFGDVVIDVIDVDISVRRRAFT